METWRPGRLLKLLLAWSAVTFIVFWLPVVRGAMDGPTYRWEAFGWMGGHSVLGDYWLVVLLAAGALLLLYRGWRGARRPFHWLLLAWHSFLAIGAVRLAVTQPENFRFRGDTLGVDVSLAWVGPALFGGFALAAGWWVARDLRRRRERPNPKWNDRNRRLLWLALVLLPVQFVLLRFGEPHGSTDQIGVLLTLAQWALLNVAFYPWTDPRLERAAAHAAG